MGRRLDSNGVIVDEVEGKVVREVEQQTIVAFGVRVVSRYGHVREIIRLLSFLDAEASKVPESVQMIKEITYDGKGDEIFIDLRYQIKHEPKGKEIAADLAKMCVELLNVHVTVSGPGINVDEAPDLLDDRELGSCRIIGFRPRDRRG